MRFVTPQSDYFCGRPHAVVGGEEQALEHVGQVPKVEDVVELHGGRHEHLINGIETLGQGLRHF